MIEGVRIRNTVVHEDHRGSFTEIFRKDEIPLDTWQVNCSASRQGVIRGVHYADIPPGQAKYVTCVKGAILDVIVDIRTGSPTFGEHMPVFLDDEDRQAVFIPAGLGHAFQAVTDCTVIYLCSAVHVPLREHGISPVNLGIRWLPLPPILSEKDAAAPSLEEARVLGLLPRYLEGCE